MAPFGFNSDDQNADGHNPNREELEAMMRQMQEQIAQQLSGMGIAGMGMPGFGPTSTEVLPLATVRETAKKFTSAKGSQPLGTKDVTAINSACEIADIWLNEATVFPANSSTASRASSRLDWVDSTLTGWHATMEPLATGLSTAISRLLDEAIATGAAENENMGPLPIGAIAGLLRSFIGTMIASQLGEAIGAISTTAVGAHDAGLPILEPARPLLIQIGRAHV